MNSMLAYFGAEENISGVVAFQPTVLKGLGYTSTEAQVHSIPIYLVAFVFSLTFCYTSERIRQRFVFAFIGGLCTLVGLSIEIAQPKQAGVRYAGMYFITAGTYITMPILVVWSAINVSKGYKRTVAFGLVIATGNAGALISSNVFITKESPKYPTGTNILIALKDAERVADRAISRLQRRHGHELPIPGLHASSLHWPPPSKPQESTATEQRINLIN
jgi:hypothetical protein